MIDKSKSEIRGIHFNSVEFEDLKSAKLLEIIIPLELHCRHFGGLNKR
jgi:hypothetical protein